VAGVVVYGIFKMKTLDLRKAEDTGRCKLGWEDASFEEKKTSPAKRSIHAFEAVWGSGFDLLCSSLTLYDLMRRGIPYDFRLHLRFVILSRTLTLSSVSSSCQSSVLLHQMVITFKPDFQQRDVRAQRHIPYSIPYKSHVFPARPSN
jgi:hypothetical protein